MEPNINSALSKGLFQQIRFLIEFGQSVNHRDEERRTPLMNCSLIEDISWGVGLARLFIEKGANINHRDKRGLNAMHYACIYDRIELARIYLKSMDFDLNQSDRLGNTALHYAAFAGKEDITKLLIETLKHFKLSVDKVNKRGATPLLLAWKNGHIACARLLTDFGEADNSIVDPSEKKCAKDYENDFMNSQRPEVTYGEENDQENTRPTRPKTAVGNTRSIRGVREGVRPLSALNGGKRRARARSASLQSNSLTNLRRKKIQQTLTSDQPEENDMFKRDSIAAKPIRSASLTELRNKPDYIFQVTPAECFVNQGHRVHLSHRGARCQSAGSGEEIPSWRSGMSGLYKNYDFQFTRSFRKGAIPPDPETLRPASPNPSDCTSEAISDRAVSGQSKKLLRKQSNANMSKLLAGDKNKKSLKPGSRRGSIVNMGISESSSSESLNSLNKMKRRQSTDGHDDSSDVSITSTHVTSGKEKQKEKVKSPRKESETRPGSRTGHHSISGSGKESRSMHVIKE